MHVSSDQLVFRLSKEFNIKTALLVPPVVYGTSDSIKDRSITLPVLVDAAKERGKIFQIGEAKNSTSTLHVKDLADVFVYFTEQALALQTGESKLEWGEKGVYYIEAGEVVLANVADAIAKEMFKKGMIGTAEVEKLSDEEALKIHPWALTIWGANMRIKASRLRALGWAPKQQGVLESVPGLLK